MKKKKEEGLTYEETSKRFGINIRSLFRWKKEIIPKTTRNKPATKIDMEALKRDVEKNPDRYQHERAKDYNVSAWAIGIALRRLNISNKKNSVSPQGRRNTAD
jgi:transposase